MDHYEFSKSVRKEILSDKKILNRLRKHFLGEKRLRDIIDAGSHNIIYRVGKLENDLWLATREPVQTDYAMSRERVLESARSDILSTGTHNVRGLEIYCKQAAEEMNVWRHISKTRSWGVSNIVKELLDKGDYSRLTTSFCIGIKFRQRMKFEPEKITEPLYALIVEDLTQGGKLKIEKIYEESVEGKIQGTDLTVQFDFDGEDYSILKRTDIPNYITKENLIIFEPN